MSLERNPNFRRWFGPSRVVDSDGRPLRVFHGTANHFAAFDPSIAGKNTGGRWNWGIFFTNNNIHQATGVVDPENGERVLHDVASATYFAKVASLGRHAADTGDTVFEGANILPVYVSLQNPMMIAKTGQYTAVDFFDRHHERLRQKMLAGGHDGIIVRDPVHLIDGEPETLVVALDSCQVKSAIGNSGAFDPRNPDITDGAGQQLVIEDAVPRSPEDWGLDPDGEDYRRDAAKMIADHMRAYGQANHIDIEMAPFRNALGDVIAIELTDFFAEEPGRGAGTGAMSRMIALADALDISVCLRASTERTRAFYQRFGFEKSGRHFAMMERHPPLPVDLRTELSGEDAPCP